jgi:hypothetical protein
MICRLGVNVNKKKSFLILLILLLIVTIFIVTSANAGSINEPLAVKTDTDSGVMTLSTTQTTMQFDDTNPLVTVSQCGVCHGADYDDFVNPGLIFKHDPHLARGVRCAVCHAEFPHQPGVTNKPRMDACFSCHGVSHLEQGVVADGTCTKCHPAGFKRLPKDHSKEFKEKEHGGIAKKDSFACTACHGNGFCVKCHAVKKVLPKDHGEKPADKTLWKKQHGKAGKLDGCSICHDKKSCLSCHDAEMPHPVFWLGSHQDSEKTSMNDCKTCHESKRDCSTCHHQFELTTILVQKNCEKCHDDYKESLETLLAKPKSQRSTGVILHKAHFEMGKTDPYECSECHERDYADAKGCFSFELCYECHGRERGGSPIAKWGGQELCYRCHKTK